tara:strand:+ start:4916 stop:5674 length:759 start_codon:yes stop_codon:yes gene_type:complete
MDHLQTLHPHARDERITFEEGPHIYTIDGDSSFTSVTTWAHSNFGHFDADKIISKMMRGRNWINSKYFDMTREEIKASWEKNRDEAAAAGTKMHYDIECFYNDMTIKNDSTEYAYFQRFQEDFSHLTPYRTEWMVWDKELKIAGSIDMLFTDSHGNLLIYDWKRSKEIKMTNKWQSSTNPILKDVPDTNFWHYSLQLNIYKYLIEKNYDKTVTGLFLVIMHPNNKNKTYIRLEVPDLQDKIKLLAAQRLASL